MNENEIYIHLFADNLVARAGLVAILEAQPDCLIVGQSTSHESVDLAIDTTLPDVIVVDFAWNMAGVIRSLHQSNRPDLPVIGLIAEEVDAPRAISSLQHFDAYGLLLRECDPDVLITALKSVSDGLVVLDAELAQSVIQPTTTTIEPLQEALTPREMQVIQNLARGLTNKAIAQKLQITDHTVKFHVTAIMTKLDAQSRTEAVVRATQLGLIAL